MEKTNKDALATTIATRLKELRKAKTDLGQKEVAEEIGITKQALSNYESGKHLPDPAILIDLANYYRCTTDYLYGLTDKTTQTPPDYSQRESVNQLLHAMETVAEDEGDYLVSTTADILYALSISEKNQKRREFIELFGELNVTLAEYVKATTKSGTFLSQKDTTAEDVAIEAARFYGYDDIAKVVEDIRRIGFAAVMSFSANSKKALRIRTGWNVNKQKASEIAKKFTKMLDKIESEDEQNGKKARTKRRLHP